MLDDIILKFANNKNINQFDFSLRPDHDIDNPFAKISLNIINNLEQAISNADKSVLEKVLLDEAEENINFAYKIYSQIVEMAAEEEGMFFKARLIEIINELENVSEHEYEELNDLLDFANTLTIITENKIHENKLKSAFIISMLLFEAAEEMRIRNIHIPFILEYKEYIINNQLTLIHVIFAKAFQHNNQELNDFFINEILQYINKFSHDKNNDVCFDMLYFASLLTNEESADIIKQAAVTLKKHTSHISTKSLLDYINTGILLSNKGSEAAAEYANKHVNNLYSIGNITNTFMLINDINCAEKVLEYIIENKRISKYFKLSFYKQLQTVYSILQKKDKFAAISKEKFALGDKNAYFDAVEAFKSIGTYEQEKESLHNIACKQVPIYDYCYLLADNKEYDFIIDRFNMIKSTKDISEAIKFMDDKGIALYDNEINKKLLQILEKKTVNYKKLDIHVKNLLSLITI